MGDAGYIFEKKRERERTGLAMPLPLQVSVECNSFVRGSANDEAVCLEENDRALTSRSSKTL